MKRFISFFLLLCITAIPLARAEDPVVDDNVYYTEEDDMLFNRGRFVGEDDYSYLRAAKRERNKHWAIALGSTCVGIATLIFVHNQHEK